VKAPGSGRGRDDAIGVRTDRFYAPDYRAGRTLFREAAQGAGARLDECLLPGTGLHGEALAVDVARLGSPDARRAVVVSSGLHGVEGFFGSAVQSAWLSRYAPETSLPAGLALVFLHALNPWGFSYLRRANEENVDLNRNFLAPGENFQGAPPGYARLDPLLNPPLPPRRWDCFRLRAGWEVLRHSMAELKQTVAVGQYEFPRGLFYGGSAHAPAARTIAGSYRSWVRPAREVLHLDLHSGLGAYGRCCLLLDHPEGTQEVDWFRRHFDSQGIEPRGAATGVAYPARGTLGQGLQHSLGEVRLRFAVAEFGTYSPLRVLHALRRENQAHFYAAGDSPQHRRAKRELRECFCPADPLWRAGVLGEGCGLIDRCVASLA